MKDATAIAYVAQGETGFYLAHDKGWTPYLYQAETFPTMTQCEQFARDVPGFVKVKEIVIF